MHGHAPRGLALIALVGLFCPACDAELSTADEATLGTTQHALGPNWEEEKDPIDDEAGPQKPCRLIHVPVDNPKKQKDTSRSGAKDKETPASGFDDPDDTLDHDDEHADKA